MNFKGVLRTTASFLYLLTILFAVGFFFSYYFQLQNSTEKAVTIAFLQSFAITIATAFILHFLTKGASTTLELREALLTVAIIWLLSVFFCALPFTLSGALEHSIDAWFETVSSLTTTGASILQAKNYALDGLEIPIHKVITSFHPIEYSFYGTVKPVIDPVTHAILQTGVEAFPAALRLWRNLLSWVGGAGMVLLFVALLPALGDEAKKLFRYESTGPSFSPLFPKARQTALVLFKIYGALTFFCLIALLLTNPALSFFDALNITFSTISTGGFSTQNAGIAAYNSFTTELVVMLFMICGAINFSYYYEIMRGRLYKLRDAEFVMFFVLLAAFSIFVSLNIFGTHVAPIEGTNAASTYDLSSAFRYGSFQAISCMTTTGFSTANYDEWPFFSQAIMAVSMFFGGMSGSTSAGLKIIRICILWKCLRYAIDSVFKRNQIRILHLQGREIDSETAFGVLAFFLTMVFVSLLGVLLLVLADVDLETAFGLNASMINNSGNSFRMAGPLDSCAFLSPFCKGVCITLMLLGRLEFYAWFTLLLPSFWKNR